MNVLQECSSQSELDAAEISWINKLDTIAPRGYNIRLGGSRGKHNATTIEKLRARVFTPEWRAKISAAGKVRPPISEATRRKLSVANLGRKRSEAYLEQFSRGANNPRAKLTEAQVIEIRKLYRKGGISQLEIAARYGVNQTNVSFIVRGVSWPTCRNSA